MEESSANKSKVVKLIKLLLKITVSAACLWYVSTKINFAEVFAALKTAETRWLIAAFAIFIVSKLIASRRLNIYFRNINIHLPEWQNIKLYWMGMFYNLFLPGAITGDAYKIVLLSKRYTISYKKTTAAVLLDRFSGLLSIGIIAAFYSSFVLREKVYIYILISGAILSVPLFYFLIKKFFPDFLPSFWPTFFLGAAVQLCMLICIYFILFALNIDVNREAYIFVFLIAAVASVLPISIGGGLGVREFAMIEGAKYVGLGQHTAVLISLLFYIITVICSLAGIIFVFKNPLPQQEQTLSKNN